MELKYTHGGIVIENKVITALDEFVLEFTKLLGKYVDEKFMKALNVRGEAYGIEV